MDLTAQDPADGVMKTGDSMYRIACNCGTPEHDVTMSVDLDDRDMPSITFYTQTSTTWWKQPFKITYTEGWPLWQAKLFLNAAINKVSLVYDVLFKGRVEFETVVILTRQQCLTLAEILLQADAVSQPAQQVSEADRVSP